MLFDDEIPVDYRDEIFRINCVEINSELINPKYEEFPIYFVDNALDENDRMEYEDYIFYGRNGMPSWKDYYSIKNLVETLEEIDGLENKDALTLLDQVEQSFISRLFNKIDIEQDKLTCPLKKVLFSILQKLDLFYPEKETILSALLMIDSAKVKTEVVDKVREEYPSILKEDQYCLTEEKNLIEIMFCYFTPESKAVFDQKLSIIDNERKQEKLVDYLSKVKVV